MASSPTSTTVTRSGRADPGVGRLQRHQRLVLDGPPQGRVRHLVADVLEPQPPPGAEHEVGVALVLPEGLDEQLAAVGEPGEVRGRAPGVHAGARQRRHPEAGAGERVHQLRPVRAQARPPDQQQRGRPDHGAERDRGDHVQRHLQAGHHPGHGEDGDQRPGGPPPPAGQPGAGQDGGGGRPADPGAAGEGRPATRDSPGQGLFQEGRPEAVEPPGQHPLEDGGGQRDGDEQHGQAEPAQDEGHRDQHQRGRQGHELRQPDEEHGQRRRHPVDRLEQVGLDPHHGVLGPARPGPGRAGTRARPRSGAAGRPATARGAPAPARGRARSFLPGCGRSVVGR